LALNKVHVFWTESEANLFQLIYPELRRKPVLMSNVYVWKKRYQMCPFLFAKMSKDSIFGIF
jgi:hypothetical protein